MEDIAFDLLQPINDNKQKNLKPPDFTQARSKMAGLEVALNSILFIELIIRFLVEVRH
jgi:hypothetical protein